MPLCIKLLSEMPGRYLGSSQKLLEILSIFQVKIYLIIFMTLKSANQTVILNIKHSTIMQPKDKL